MSVLSTFTNEYGAALRAARQSPGTPCPEGASAETRLGFIAAGLVQAPPVSEIVSLLNQIDQPRRAAVSAGFHAALMNKHLVGGNVSTTMGTNAKALVQVLRDAASASVG